MEKITEKLLLEKSSTRTNKLEQIASLNLAGRRLKSNDISVALWNKLTGLKELNLSGNMLQHLPAGLCLPSLRVLNLSNNEMEDIISLKSLSNLEELQLEDNLYLTVSDEHKVMFLLPKLRMLNGKDISSTANHIRYVNSEILMKRVISLWEKSFSLPDPLTSERLNALEKKFVNAAVLQVKYGPSSLNDYTKWRVEMIAKEYLKSLTDPEDEECLEETPVAHQDSVCFTPKRKSSDQDSVSYEESPSKKKKISKDPTPEDSPRKSNRIKNNAPVEESPRKVTRLQESPQKSGHRSFSSPRKSVRVAIPEASPKKSNQLRNTPQKNTDASPKKHIQTPKPAASKNTKAVTPKKNLNKQSVVKCTETENGKQQKEAKSQVPKEPASLQPFHVLQCHSKQDSPEDFNTQLWTCAFEPTLNNGPGDSSHIVATCGGESVCVIDCETGLVLKKYKVPGEEFFTLAWTTLWMTREGGSSRSCTVLAAGGKRGLVKLIHPRANLAYGEFRASRRALSVLRFSPCNASFLFTGGYDNRIVMWDIGGFDRDYNYKTSQLLILETDSTPLHLCFPPSSPGTHILSGCDNGMYSFDIQLTKNTQKREEEMEVIFPVYKKQNKTNYYRTIDGLSFLTDDIVASKSHMQGSIYLWSWRGTRAMRQGKKKEVSAVILAELQWSNTDVPYLSLNTCPGFGYVVCGDEKGRLWTYHITDRLRASFKSGKPIPATEVLNWPSPVRKGVGAVEGPSINSVTMDPALRYLVALSDKNMVLIWKRKSEQRN